ncbi:MAG: cupin-like domain-containing protein [Planctomycetota bacterium]
MSQTAPLAFGSYDSKQDLARAHSPLGSTLVHNAFLLTRVLARQQSLGADLERRWLDPAIRVRDEDLPSDDIVEIRRIPGDALDAHTLREVIRESVPTVLEGAALTSRAVKRWTLESLAEACEGADVPLFPEHSETLTMRFEDCVRAIREGRDPTLQVNNYCDVLTDPNGLLADLPIARMATLAAPLRYHGANLFVCRGGNGSKYHCANELNLFFQVEGEKEWSFVHPRYTPRMDPHFTVPRCNYFGSGLAWGEHPSGVPIGRTVLRPGDVLVNPPWWWHWVRNRNTTIGVATRWRSWKHRFGTDNPFFSFLQWLFPCQWKLMWTDYVRGGHLDDSKWVHREPA